MIDSLKGQASVRQAARVCLLREFIRPNWLYVGILFSNMNNVFTIKNKTTLNQASNTPERDAGLRRVPVMALLAATSVA